MNYISIKHICFRKMTMPALKSCWYMDGAGSDYAKSEDKSTISDGITHMWTIEKPKNGKIKKPINQKQTFKLNI